MSAENITINGDDYKPFDDHKGINIALYYFEFLMRWKYLISGIFISINVLMLLRLLFFVTFYYKATITILPSNTQESNLGLGAFSSLIGASMKQESNYEGLYEEILRSRRLGYKVLTKSFYSKKFGKIMPLLDILDIDEGNEKYRLEMGYLSLSGFLTVQHCTSSKGWTHKCALS